jgi:predicted transcriptional regulator
MTTLQIQLSDSLLAQIKQTADNGDTNSFVVEAINRYLKNRERQKLNILLKEGYLANYEENKALAAEFELTVGDGLD